MSRGRPILTLRLDRAEITALKISARRHGVTVSDLVRALLHEQMARDGLDPATMAAPCPGQRDIDDYLVDSASGA